MTRDIDFMRRVKVESEEKWREITPDIPYISFKDGWMVKIIPPFSGATVRFMVTKEGLGDRSVSVYLDHYEQLGFGPDGAPYWEVYPHNNDVGRCTMSDTDTLIDMIERSLFEISDDRFSDSTKRFMTGCIYTLVVVGTLFLLT